MFDLLIKNGMVIDGTGAPRFKADVAVKDGVIAKIAAEITEPAEKVIDAAGLIVSPGFIDTHTHTDKVIFKQNLTGYNHLEDGATTELAGQCGSHATPYYGEFDPSVGISEEELLEKVREQARAYYIDMFSGIPDAEREQYGYYDMLDWTVSDAAVNLDLPIYIDRMGSLCVYARVGSLAGAGEVWTPLYPFEAWRGYEDAVG